MTMFEKPACPECGSHDVLPIVYGLPSPELEGKAIMGEVMLGVRRVWRRPGLGCRPAELMAGPETETPLQVWMRKVRQTPACHKTRATRVAEWVLPAIKDKHLKFLSIISQYCRMVLIEY
jgi:hypothetical protein